MKKTFRQCQIDDAKHAFFIAFEFNTDVIIEVLCSTSMNQDDVVDETFDDGGCFLIQDQMSIYPFGEINLEDKDPPKVLTDHRSSAFVTLMAQNFCAMELKQNAFDQIIDLVTTSTVFFCSQNVGLKISFATSSFDIDFGLE
uniref:Uncharacterized protein n=1 Tax=Romanomermis culicivorax TaxID=13658 RepID=A0A915I1N4_ROMCU